jgi:predicted amidohydrolase YtcJ
MLRADIVLRRGNMVTMDGEFPSAESIAVAGDRILAIGSDREVENLAGPGTKTIELGGRTVVPGLHDSHIHTMGGAADELAVSLAEAGSIADVQSAFARRAAATPPGEWLVGGSGWHESQLAEGRLPTRVELDAVAPNHPVFLRRGGHVAVANSVALSRAGIGKETPDPVGGVIVRDPETGEPTGALIERPAFGLVAKLIPAATREDLVAGLKLYTKKLNSRGVTATLEPGLNLEEIAAYMEMWRRGAMTTRARLLQRVTNLDDVEALSSILAPNFGDDWLRIGGFKFLSDGGIEAAYLGAPYRLVEGEQTDPNFVGKLLLPPGGIDELREMLTIAAKRGWQVQVHAVGDAAISRVVDLMEEVDRIHKVRDLRWVIMHIFLPTKESLEKIKRIGLWTTVQDHPVKLGHNMIRYWGEERAASAIPIRTIIAAGIPAGGGTDAPVVDWNPFESMWWMTTRNIFIQGRTDVLGADEAISREQALRLYTVGSAGVAFAEDRLGSLAPGKLADLAVLSDDFLTVPDDRLRDIQSVLTMVGGKIVHRNDL